MCILLIFHNLIKYNYLFMYLFFRLRLLKDKPYSQAEAEMASGMGSFTIQVTHNGKPIANNKKTEKVAKTASSMDTFSPVSLTNTSNVMEGLNIG